MRRIKIYKILLLNVLVFTLIWPAFTVQAAGASLYLTPSAGTFVIEGAFKVNVRLDTGGEVINASEGTISFDSNLLEVTSISEGSSIFSIWIVKPSFDNKKGTASFSGGMPRPGYKGAAGQLFAINFKGKKAGTAQIRFSTGAVLANDEKGTNILASMGSASFIISPKVEAPNQGDIGTSSNLSATLADDTSYNEPIITSPTHPDQNTWYNKNDIKFNWKLGDGTTGISFSFDKILNSDPGAEAKELITEKEYQKTEDGIWYFHLKFKDVKKWGTISHFRVMVDTKPPTINSAKVNQIQVGDWPVLSLDASDKESGINRYEIIIGSLENKSYELTGQENTFKLANLETGEHKALIKVIDNAQNISYQEINFNIEPIETPKIINYPQELKSSDKFYINGTALPNVDINVAILSGDKLVSAERTKSSSNGDWFLISQTELSNDRFFAFAEAINANGVKSLPSDKVAFLVTPPVFARIGSWVINYFTVFVSLLFMVILIVALIIYLVSIARRRLKKETVEVEQVLGKYLDNLKSSLDEEFANLDKVTGTVGYKKERIRAKARIKANIEDIEKKIGKEVKDVEELLK